MKAQSEHMALCRTPLLRVFFLSLLLHKKLSIVHNVSDRANNTLKFMKRVSSVIILRFNFLKRKWLTVFKWAFVNNCLRSRYVACGEMIHASWYPQGAEAHVVELISRTVLTIYINKVWKFVKIEYCAEKQLPNRNAVVFTRCRSSWACLCLLCICWHHWKRTEHLPAMILPKNVTLIRKSELIFNRKPLQRTLRRF